MYSQQSWQINKDDTRFLLHQQTESKIKREIKRSTILMSQDLSLLFV